MVVALFVLAVLAVGVLLWVTWVWVLPLLVDNALLVAAALGVTAALLLLDRLTRPWLSRPSRHAWWMRHVGSGASRGGGGPAMPIERSPRQSPTVGSTLSTASLSFGPVSGAVARSAQAMPQPGQQHAQRVSRLCGSVLSPAGHQQLTLVHPSGGDAADRRPSRRRHHRFDRLAAAAGCDADALHHVLGHLVGKGVFEETAPGRLALNDTARGLLDGSPAAALRLEHPLVLRHRVLEQGQKPPLDPHELLEGLQDRRVRQRLLVVPAHR